MRTVKEITAATERAWARGQLEERERGRMAALMAKPSPGDQRLFTPTKCRVLRTFCVQGQPVEIGSVVTLAKHDAESLAASGKVTIL